MTYYMQNGADDGTVIAYPDHVAAEVEEFLYKSGHGSAYPFCPVQGVSEEYLIEEGFSVDEIKEVSAEDIAIIYDIMNAADDGKLSLSEAGDDISDITCGYVYFP